MKIRSLLLAAFAGMALTVSAQTHVQGIEYYKADQLTNAQELLLRNLNNPNTDKSLSYYYLGQIEVYQKNLKGAEKYFNDGIAANPDDPYNYIGLGYLQLKSGNVKEAEKYFKDAEKKGGKDQSVQVEIARAYYNADKVGYKDKYEKRIENALKKDGKNPDIYILQGDILRDEAYQTEDSNTYGKAASKYDMATSFDPTSAVAYVKYADMYTNAHNPNYAIQKLIELLNNNPNSALGQRQLANAYYDTQQFGKAADQYGKYVQNPNHFKSDEDRYALILFADGKYLDGYNYATKLLQENPSNFTAQRFQFINAAQIPAMANDLLPLADKLMAAHKANPDNKFASIDYTLISDELAKGGRIDEAIALINEGIAEQPTNGNFDKSLASIYINAEDYGKAADAYKGYLDKTPNAGYADLAQQALYAYFGGLQNLSDVTNKETGEIIRPKNPDAANKYFNMATTYANKAAEASPSAYKPHKILGDIAKDSAPENQVGKAAVPEYIKAVELFEANPDSRFNNDAKYMYAYLAAYYLENGNMSDARSNINKALAIDPDNTNYKAISDAIK